jgi:FixJ family two-component response regulator
MAFAYTSNLLKPQKSSRYNTMRRETGPPFEAAVIANEVNGRFQSFLYQAAAPTVFLDADLNILFFTPATTALINILAVDIGRPLVDLSTAGLGEDVSAEVAYVLAHGGDLEREIISPDQRSYRRRIAPFKAPGLLPPGILITFADHTNIQQLAIELSRIRKDIEICRANHLNVLSALSHDLRQPLQTLKLLQALLRETLHEVPTLQLAEQIGDTLSAMSGVINLISENTPITLQSDLVIASLPTSQASAASHRGIILIVEDDSDLLNLLGTLLHHQGYEVALALDSAAALSWIFHSGLKPDLILADYHLGTDMNGLELIGTLRNQWHSEVPAIVLTGDVSGQTAFDVAAARCAQLNKPAKLKELIQLVHSMFAQLRSEHSPRCECPSTTSVIYVVDNDKVMRDTVRQILQAEDYRVYDFATCEAFLLAYSPQERACLLLDARLPGMNGIDMLRGLRQQGDQVPIIIISGSGDIAIAVEAMKAGAWDFIEKPCNRNEMLDSINRALGRSQQNHRILAGRQGAIDYIATLTARQRQIMDMVLAGHPSKNIAVDLGISQRTVENHRASIMTRTHSRSIPALARLALAASLNSVEGAVMDTLHAPADRRCNP